jgi:hypothetical protein
MTSPAASAAGRDLTAGQTVKYQGRWYEIQSFWDKSEGGPLGSYRVAGGWSPTTGRSKRGMILLDDRDYPVRNP